MNIFVSAIGSGNTLNFVHNKNYAGIIAISENIEKFGLFYARGGKTENLSQNDVFKTKFAGTDYKIKELLEINGNMSSNEAGSIIMDKLDEIKNSNPKAKFHFEISAGYKKLGHLLTLISYIRKDIYKLTFLNFDGTLESLPLINIKLTKDQNAIFTGYAGNCKSDWNGKIASNKFIFDYRGNRKFPYRVIKHCKEMGLIDDNNYPTEFGKLYAKYSLAF